MANTSNAGAVVREGSLAPDGCAPLIDPHRIAVVVTTVEVIELFEIAPALGWFRWRHVGRPTLVEHGYEEIEVQWLDDGVIRRSFVETSECPSGRALSIVDGGRSDPETERVLLRELATDLECWDTGGGMWHADLYRPNDKLDEAFEVARRTTPPAAELEARDRQVAS